MKKIFVSVSIVALLVVIVFLVSPFFIDRRVSEISPLTQSVSIENETPKTIESKKQPQLVARGSFTGFDKIHYGSGTVSLIKSETGYTLRFEEDFNVANGPDLYVGLGNDGTYIKGSEIAKLKGNIGSQNYNLPEDFDLNASNEVWIWCKAFSVPFAKVSLIER